MTDTTTSAPAPKGLDELDSAAVRGFAAAYGEAPTSLWAAPGRVNFIGEHTDYNDGFVLPFAIDRHTVMAARVRDDRLVRVSSSFTDEIVEISIDDLSAESVSGWSAYPLGVIWAAGVQGADLARVPGLDLYVVSDIPVGAGLSSSAALESVVGIAIDELWGLGFDRRTLAVIGRRAENEAVGAPTGIMDQSAVLLGRLDSAVLIDCRSLETRVVPLGLDDEELVIVVTDTRVEHEHATGGYAARRASCELGARTLGVPSLRDLGPDDLGRAEELLDDETFRRVRHIITENERVLDLVRTLEKHGAGAVGAQLDASHTSMRDDFEISVPELDLSVEVARRVGAIGSRMTGGGFGGSSIALIHRSKAEALAEAQRAAFAEAGYREPVVFTVVPSEGAVRRPFGEASVTDPAIERISE
ncbi:galactokinase [Herbiconiux flava]|uniref:Galactokinase n=1 Tax=Herbiconiux flava TaxID=881268 RepID=A0A852S9H9_9MICO|nr:galactokinase [Herbiconiux flava]NYD69002.1 galactokinase [Herbiconiux flava]GLK15750.1 galactokinase [Herbiconiux flava]